VRQHHEAAEWDPAQPVSRDKASEVGETSDEWVHRERRNSCCRDRQLAQEQEQELAEQDARLRWENPLLAQNLYPDFARALNTLSEVGGVLAQKVDDLPRTPDVEGYRRLLTQAANLLPLAHPANDLHHAINSRRDERSTISSSRDRRHENEIRHREEYDRDHGVLARIRATRIESAGASTNSPFQGRLRRPNTDSLPRTNDAIICKRMRAESPRLLLASGPSNGLLTSRSPTSTNMSLSRTWEAGWPSIQPPLGLLGQRRTS
jgi:hypothetical protein